jgi:hypothetical protein
VRAVFFYWRQWIKKIQGQVEQGLSYDDDQLTLGQFMLVWLGNKKTQVRVSTYDGYRWTANKYILPDLGTIRLRDLSPGLVQEYYDHLVNSQDKAGKANGPVRPGNYRSSESSAAACRFNAKISQGKMAGE